MKSLNQKRRSGLTLVEVVIAAAIILVAVVTLSGVHGLYLKVALSNGDAVKGAYLAEEGIEALRFLRDSSWDGNIATLSAEVPYGMVFLGGVWQASGTALMVDDFRRTITLSTVSRDVDGDIVSSGGTLDPDTLMVVSSVSWASGGATTTKSVSTYLTNLFDN